MTVLKELSQCKSSLVGVQEVRWEGGGTEPNGEREPSVGYSLFLFVHTRVISAVEFLTDTMSYIILRGRWCHSIVQNVHAPTVDKTDEAEDSFYGELERVFDKFPKYEMKILLGDFNAKVGREDIFKPTIGNESLH
jgi:hypothetical protein